MFWFLTIISLNFYIQLSAGQKLTTKKNLNSLFMILKCPCFSWDRVGGFFCSGQCDAMFDFSLLTYWCFSCWALYRAKDISSCPSVVPTRGLGVTRNWEGAEPGQLTQSGQRDVPHYLASFWTINLGELSCGGNYYSGCFSAGGEQLQCVSLVLIYTYIKL